MSSIQFDLQFETGPANFEMSSLVQTFACLFYLFNPLPDDKFLDWPKLKQSADDNFKFDENTRKFSKRVENTVVVTSKFSFSHSVFKRLVSHGRQNVSLCRNWLKGQN